MAAQPTKILKPLFSFEPASDRFAVVSDDSRLRIFDVRTGQLKHLLAEKDHLSIQYTAIAWGSAKPLGGPLALGTSMGRIVLWDLVKGHVHKVLGGSSSGSKEGKGHSGKVNGLAFTEGGAFLFSCSEDLRVIKWNVENGEIVSSFKADSQPVSSLALSADNASLATGSAMIKLWDLASGKSQRKFTGHASSITSLCFSGDGKLLASASSNERYTSVWNLEAEGAASVFTSTSNPVHVDFNNGSRQTGKKKAAKEQTELLLAVLRSGSVGVWEIVHQADGDGDAPNSRKPDATIKVLTKDVRDEEPKMKKKKKKSDKNEEEEETDGKKSKKKKSKPVHVLLAQFVGKNQVLLAYGKAISPVFQRVNLRNETTGQLEKKITLYDESGLSGALTPGQDAPEKKRTPRASVLGPHQLDPVVPANVTSGPATTKSKAKKQSPADNLTLQERLDRMQLAAVEDAAEEAGDEKKKGEEDEEQDALSDDDEDVQGDRALEKEVQSLVRVWGGDDKKKFKLSARKIIPKATSLASALGQAIHTKDKNLLENVLGINQEQVIFCTVRRLQQDHVLPFLQLVLARFRGNPNRSVSLLVWIRAVLVEHVAYLSTVPELLATLSDLYATVRTRLANYKRFVKLAGRLELLGAQIQAQQAHHMTATRSNKRIYREDDDDGTGGSDDEVPDGEAESSADEMEVEDGDEQDAMEDDDEEEDDEEEEGGDEEKEEDSDEDREDENENFEGHGPENGDLEDEEDDSEEEEE